MGHVRSNAEVKSKLPVFEARRSSDYPSWAVVTCPREDCDQEFLVRISTWYKPRRYTTMRGDQHTITGRSCPYCFRAARLPSRRAIR